MTSPEGGFYSAQDADSEGEEGKFFVWDRGGVSRRCSAPTSPPGSCTWFGAHAVRQLRGTAATCFRVRGRRGLRGSAKSMQPEAASRRRSRSRAASSTTRARSAVEAGARRRDPADWNGLMIGAFARGRLPPRRARSRRGGAQGGGVRARELLAATARLLRALTRTARRSTPATSPTTLSSPTACSTSTRPAFDPADLAFARDARRAPPVATSGTRRTAASFTTARRRAPDRALEGGVRRRDAVGPSVAVMDLLRLAGLLGDDGCARKAKRTLRSTGRCSRGQRARARACWRRSTASSRRRARS